MAPAVVIAVPRRDDGGRRDRIWSFCRAYWERELDWPIIEGHHDTGPFNRAAAINRAAVDGGAWDAMVILDSDIVVDIEPLRLAVDRAMATGRMVMPFTHRRSVNQRGTDAILDGYKGSWRRWNDETQAWNVSTALVVPRRLWDQVGGFDERFVGWGGEDEAFHAACLALAGVDRLPGDAWHLWHPPAPWKDHRSVEYRQVLALSNRYVNTASPGADRRRPDLMACADPEPMRRLLTEPRTSDQVAVVVITNGARDTLAKTLHSAEQMLDGPIGRRVICDGSKGTHGRIAAEHPDWDVVDTGNDPGYALAMRRAYEVALGSGQPWIFWLEDDFTFNDRIDVRHMQAVMDAHPELVQLALLRQPWYQPELEAGGIFQAHPEQFTQRSGFVEHRAFWTSNPMLCRRSFLARHRWPHQRWSEGRFGKEVFKDPAVVAGFLGCLDDVPRVTHIGVERAGNGY